MTNTSCPYCSSNRISLASAIVSEKVTVAGAERAITYRDEHHKCENCGEIFATYEQARTRESAYAQAIARANGGYTGAEIRALRERYCLKQSEFETALGLGKKTLVRWERGTVPPSAAAVGLLWVADQHPEVFAELAGRNGISIDTSRLPLFTPTTPAREMRLTSSFYAKSEYVGDARPETAVISSSATAWMYAGIQ